MPPPVKSRFWRRARVAFRWIRITGWLLILAVICALLWLNRVGLPDFLTRPLLADLRAHGLEVQFARVRLRLHGIAAENIHFEQVSQTSALRLTAGELMLRLDSTALQQRQLKLRGVTLIDGRLTVPLIASNRPPHELVLDHLQAQVDFLSEERWQLSAFDGQAFGIDFHLSGTVTNASALLAWKGGEAEARQRAESWNRFVTQLEQIQFTPAAKMKGIFSSDAKALEASTVQVEISAEQFKSPWAAGRDLALSVAAEPRSNAVARLTVALSSRGTQTPWAQAATLHLTGNVDLPFAAPQPENVRLNLDAEAVQTPWARAQELHLSAEAAVPRAPRWGENSQVNFKARQVRTTWAAVDELALLANLSTQATNAALTHGTCEVRAQRLRSRWLDATNALLTASTVQPVTNLWPESLTARLELQQVAAKSTNTTSGLVGTTKIALLDATLTLPPSSLLFATNTAVRPWWEQILATAHAELEGPQAGPFDAERISFTTKWDAPALGLDSFQASLYGGQMNATARLDVATRELRAAVTTDFDPHQLTPLFVTNANDWKVLLSWEKPPHLQADLRFTLPPWTNRPPDWRGELLSSLALSGSWQTGSGAVRSVPFMATRSGFALTNQVWQVRELEVTRSEGRARLDLECDNRTRDFHSRLVSSIDPQALRPLFDSDAARSALDRFVFGQPPRLDAELWGRVGDWERLGGKAEVALTNVSFRGQTLKSCVARAAYTNQVLDVLDACLEREEGVATVDQVRVDFRREAVSLTNVQSTIEVAAVANAIGPHIAKTLAPYQFTNKPPTVHFEGTIGIRNRSGLDDALFEVSGGPFRWQNFHLTNVTAHLHWLRDTLTITNFEGALQGGEVKGSGFFDFPPDMPGTAFQFELTATNVNAKPLLTDLFPGSTNRLEGFLSGQLIITNATTADAKSWFGHGDVNLRDGLIWDEPVFKLFSPMLNTVVPGLGNSRARHATATYTITNSVIATRDLEIAATGMRMQYDGTVDFDGRIHGTMEAELLRNTPGFGWLVSRLLWPVTKIFEYKVSGTLAKPKTSPLFIPKVLMAPLHPLRTLKELFSEDKTEEPKK